MIEPGALRRDELRDGGGVGDIWTLYVGLLLALLTFFIVLVALSSRESERTAAVLDGVQRTFAPERPRGSPPLAPEDGLFVAGRAALVELGGDLAGLIRLAQVSFLGRGDEMRVRLPVSEVFAPDSVDLVPGVLPLLDRVVAAIGTPPPGWRLSVTFVLGRSSPSGPSPSGPAPRETGGAVRVSEVDRCGALVRALVARGAPPGSVAVGLEPSASEEARFEVRLLGAASGIVGSVDKPS